MSLSPSSTQRGTGNEPESEPAVDVEIIRSADRTKTASARWAESAGRIVVRVPAGLDPAQERELVDKLVGKVRASLRRKELRAEIDLDKRCAMLNRKYFGGRATPSSVRWVTNQNSRYGSCTPATGSIRISHRVAAMPEWVRDYVLVHELAHLLVPNHSPAFWKLVRRYSLTERARGYLIALGLESMEGEGDEVLDAEY